LTQLGIFSFVWAFLISSLAFSQTFQAPTDDVYTCFTSQETFLDANTQQIGTLEVKSESYTFTVGENSESGLITALEEDLSDVGTFVTAGSAVALKSSDDSLIVGFFVVDALGGSYVILNNAQNVWIRCDSPGADIVAAMNGLAPTESDLPDLTEQPNASPTTTSPPTNIDVAAPEPGHYPCYGSQEFTDDALDHKDGDVVEQDPFIFTLSIASLDLFANGEYSYYDGTLFGTEYGFPTGILEWADEVGRYSFHYNPERYDPGYTSLDWLTGNLRGKLYNETDLSEYAWSNDRDRPSAFYVGDNGHTEIFLGQEDWVSWLDKVTCTWDGPNKRKSSTEIMQATETPESYLQPERIVSPAPAAGAGGLDGLYISGENDVLYFMPNGYVYEGVYRWGFDSVSKVCSRYWTEVAKNSQAVCSTYLIQGNGIQIGERVPENRQECSMDMELGTSGYEYQNNCATKEGYNPATDSFLPFSQNTDGTLTIDNVVYFPFSPEQNLTLDGSYEYSWSSVSASVAAGGTRTITFTPDGNFRYGEDSYLGGYFDQGPYTDVVTSINDGQNPNAGTYSINGYTITLSFNTGLNLNYSFFRTDEDAFRLLNFDFTRATETE
jgi:hypothetical protein